MKKLISLLIIFVLIGFCGCKQEKPPQNNDKITVAVTIPPQKEFISKICGNNVNIITLLPAGASPETYELTIKQKAVLETADIYFSIGVPMEENSVLKALNKNTKNIELHKISNKIHPDLLQDGVRDPHIWLSIKRTKVMVQKIAQEMVILDKPNAKSYQDNAQKYITELSNLENEISELFKNKIQRSFIVYHPAFSYLAEDFSLNCYPLEIEGKEITAKHLGGMIDFALRNKINTVFYQAEASAKLPKLFAKEINGKAVKLNPLAENYSQNIKTMAYEIAKAMK